MNSKKYTMYFSKWRGAWVYFKDGFGNRREINEEESKELKKFKYKLK